jgi:hypothetical protein
VLAAACVRGGGASDSARLADSARVADSLIVAGQPAVPSTLVPAPDSQVPARRDDPNPARPTTRPGAGQSTASNVSATSAADSIRGIVSVVGTSFDKHVMVTSPGRRAEITGAMAGMIGHQAGAEVTVVGKTAGDKLEATGFIVRSVDGQPAIDGRLRTEAGALYIVTADGSRTRIVAPPPPLQGQDGARVWITGDPAKGVSSFGFIDPPR